MPTPNKKEEKKLLAKNFLEYDLGIAPTAKNIRQFTAHILVFEKRLKNRNAKRENIMQPK